MTDDDKLELSKPALTEVLLLTMADSHAEYTDPATLVQRTLQLHDLRRGEVALQDHPSLKPASAGRETIESQ